MYQPAKCLPPLQVDEGKDGKDSDHNILLLAPILSTNNLKREKREIKIRPLTEQGWIKFSQFFQTHKWDEVLNVKDVESKVNNFHKTLQSRLDNFFPEKVIKVSCLDKKWMTPKLKTINRQLKREFYKK